MVPWQLRILVLDGISRLFGHLSSLIIHFNEVNIVTAVWTMLLWTYKTQGRIPKLFNIHLVNKHSVLVFVDSLILVEWAHSVINVTSRTTPIKATIVSREGKILRHGLLHTSSLLMSCLHLIVVLKVLGHDLMISCQETLLHWKLSHILSSLLYTGLMFLHPWL